MQKTEAAGGVVLNARGDIALVVSGTASFWGFPKGHIDEGEDALSAGKREVEDDTGLKNLTLVKACGSYGRHKSTDDGGDDTSEWKTIRMFLFRTADVELAPKDPWNPEARWVPPAEVEDLLTHPKDKEFWRSILPDLGLLEGGKGDFRYREKNE